VTDHARSAADVAFGHRARLRAGKRCVDVLRSHMEAVDVIELAVPGLGHYGQRPPVTARVRRARPHAPCDRRVAHDADAVRIGEQDGPFERPGFLEPCGAGHLAVAIQREPAAEHGNVEAHTSAGQDRGHACTHLSSAREVLDERHVAYGDAGDVGDRVPGAGCTLERNPEVTGTGLGGTGKRRHQTQARDQDA
jgi:hypothetical protein